MPLDDAEDIDRIVNGLELIVRRVPKLAEAAADALSGGSLMRGAMHSAGQVLGKAMGRHQGAFSDAEKSVLLDALRAVGRAQLTPEAPQSLRRDQNVQIRLSDDEKRRLVERAREAGLSLSDYIRRQSLGEEVSEPIGAQDR